MSNNNGLNVLVTAVGFFLTGLAAGVLLAPKSGRENRQLILGGAENANTWVQSKGKNAREKAHQVGDTIKRSVKEHVPDLYEATDSLTLSDEDVKTARED